MDGDDISLPTRLEHQVNLLQANSAIGAVGVYSHVVSKDLQPLYDREPAQNHACILLDHYIGEPFQHAALMMRRHLVLEAGGYDQSLRYLSDCDLMTRLMGRTLFANIGKPLYVYRRHEGQISSDINIRRKQDLFVMRKRQLERIWEEAPPEKVERMARIRPWHSLSWSERRAAKRDIRRLIEAIIVADLVDASERSLLIALMNRRLEEVSPRIWQMFCHWRRHHFGQLGRLSKPQ